MEINLIENLLNLFDKCQLSGKALEINIDEDLVKILPFPRKLILDYLSEQPFVNLFRLSKDQKTLYFQNNFRLCSTDQDQSGSCHSPYCEQLHLCKSYILNESCSQFDQYGKCSYPHSLLTNHNQSILNKYQFALNDENTFHLISHLIKLSLFNSPKLIVKTTNGESITQHLIDYWLGQHKSLLKGQILINSNTIQLIFDDDEVRSMMEEYFLIHHSSTALVKKEISSDSLENGFNKQIPITNESYSNQSSSERLTLGRGRGKPKENHFPLLNNQSNPNTFSRRLASTNTTNQTKFTFSRRLNSLQSQKNSPPSTDNDKIESSVTEIEQKQTNSPSADEQNANEISSPENLNCKSRFVLRQNSIKTKEKSSNNNLIKYYYNKPFNDEHLCYLLGPGKKFVNEKDKTEIYSCLSFGYCKVKNNEQGKDIEKELYSILPDRLKIQLIQIDQQFSLIISSSAAEHIFQQNQVDYAIIAEENKIQLNIEVIYSADDQHQQTDSISRKDSSLSASEDEQQTTESSSDNKFHIQSTDSSIDVVYGDICQIPVDMMICISTSNSLRDNVLRCAGSKIESQYKERYRSTDALLLDGGSTTARKILFVPWQTDIDSSDITNIQKSLSNLVKWCIEQAHQRKMKSISFPPIGTGQLGLDPYLVCESMISAASERLHESKLDVLFVIYSSNGFNYEDECYQIFRIYLDHLSQQVHSKKVSTTTNHNQNNISKDSQLDKQIIRRDVLGKRLLTLSDASKSDIDDQSLIQSLEDLMYEKTFDLSLIDSSIVNKVDILIDICLKSNVYPRIDYSREEITLRADHDSCFQCFFNLRQDKKVYQYSYISTENQQKILNTFISLKIDEAYAVGESNVCLKDNEQLIYNIDLNKFKLRINKDKQTISLSRKELNVNGKVPMPSSWSLSFLTIRTVEVPKSSYQSFECFQNFQSTMPTSQWQIERIESIENCPLYVHFISNNQNERTKLYYHGCSYSSVQSIIHYGLHSTNASNYDNQSDRLSICLTRDILDSHLYGSRRSIDGTHYVFAVQIVQTDDINDQNMISLSNDQLYLTLPTYLIVYQRRKNFR